MEAFLTELEQKTTVQIIVITVDTIGDEDWNGWTIRHAEQWKLGQKGKDNGAIIALIVNERHCRIETGYGIEGILPDSWCGTNSRAIADRYFKKGDYSNGLLHLTILAAQRVAEDANVQLTGMPNLPKLRTRNPGVFCGGGLLPIIVFILIMSSISRRNRHYGRWGGGGLIEGMFWGSILSNMLGGGDHIPVGEAAVSVEVDSAAASVVSVAEAEEASGEEAVVQAGNRCKSCSTENAFGAKYCASCERN